MSRHYSETGRSRLIEIECDGCDARITPNPLIAESGWTQTGIQTDPASGWIRSDYCPSCSRDREPGARR